VTEGISAATSGSGCNFGVWLRGIRLNVRPSPIFSTPLHGEMAGAFRLRLGDYRVLFTFHEDVMRIFGVRHRSEAYR
jgi:mRNA-degrading endonuclease RelE of RelBE toxin-antitoxin system